MARKQRLYRQETDPNYYHGWWYCDNIITDIHKDQVGLLHMEEPQVFILVRNSIRLYCTFDEFKNGIAEVNFIHPADRQGADIEDILADAWNFMVLQEAEDERQYYSNHPDDDAWF